MFWKKLLYGILVFVLVIHQALLLVVTAQETETLALVEFTEAAVSEDSEVLDFLSASSEVSSVASEDDEENVFVDEE
jgi:hypothetical protein